MDKQPNEKGTSYSSADEIRELKARIVELEEELQPFLDKEWLKNRVKLIVGILFPGGKYDAPGAMIPKEHRHPEKYWWWNGVDHTIDDIENWEMGDGVSLELETYTGGGDTDRYGFDIPREWLKIENDCECVRTVIEWAKAGHEAKEAAKRKSELAAAERELEIAQRKVAQLKG
jgi:hypothetical protein